MTATRSSDPHTALDYSYPRERRFANRYHNSHWHTVDVFYEYFEKFKMTWAEIEDLRYTYVLYFNDLVDAVNEETEEDVAEKLGYDDKLGHYESQMEDAAERLMDYLDLNKKQREREFLVEHWDIDTFIFSKHELPDPLQIKLITGMNCIAVPQFNLFEYTYVDD